MPKQQGRTTIAAENATVEATTGVGIMAFLCQSLGVLWKDWRKDMKCTMLSTQNQFSLSGPCPHCGLPSVFTMATNAYEDQIGGGQALLHAVLRCSGCLKYILGTVLKQSGGWLYQEHFPSDKPNDSVAEEIPGHIKPDFKEALRCRWVKAYNATVEMCRRALQASCLHLGAADTRLEEQIDWLASQQKITAPLQQMAHKVRLGGNRGAHPPVDPDSAKPLTESDADAVIEFTNQFFHHVYVMPALMDKYDFSKAGTSRKLP